jgi:excisionase family DNA binding protein
MPAIDEEYLTVAEAATLLRVASSTIRRWIRQGDIPAYRIGKRRVALRRSDLPGLITPLRPYAEQMQSATDIEELKRRKLTPEEIRQGLEAMERAIRHSDEIHGRRGGDPFPPSWILIREMREERTRQLG